MREDDRLALTPEQLSKTITKVESHYFTRQHNGERPPDLDSMGRDWVAAANR